MKQKQYRAGVSSANRVVRHLKLGPKPGADVSAAVREIDELFGIDEVSVKKKGGVLNVAYDAGRLSIENIEQILSSHAIGLSNDWWTRWKEKQYRFTDQNVKDNAAYVPGCCNKLPPEVGGR